MGRDTASPEEAGKAAGPKGQQPETLATFAAAAKSGKGEKPKDIGMEATPETAPIPTDPRKKQDAATRILNEGATRQDRASDEAVDDLPDRTRTRPDR